MSESYVKNLLDLNHEEVKEFFLEGTSYCNFELPIYFSFSELLIKISDEIKNKNFESIFDRKNIDFKQLDDVNYSIYINKDGSLSWRLLQLINPIIYVYLVHEITEEHNYWNVLQNRFKEFQKNERIICLSIPVKSNNGQSDKAQQVSEWFQSVEQDSIVLSLEYDYFFETDIANCYPSIYTHSIDWAISTKKIAKSKKDKNRLGSKIDNFIQYMQCRQTNGIPQGSVLMDFIAEIILGYLDTLLSEKLNEKKVLDYKILRYRDDYKIFVKNVQDGELIIRELSEIIIPFGLKLNASKTKKHEDVLGNLIKRDKLELMKLPIHQKINYGNLKKELLLTYMHSISHPNSGSILTILNKIHKKLENSKINYERIDVLISIVTNIAYKNPRAIAICCAIISNLLNEIDNPKSLSDKVVFKLRKIPNSQFIEVWLQRMLKDDLDKNSFTENRLCKLVAREPICLWNIDWISDNNLKNIINNTSIFLQDKFNEIDKIITNEEVDLYFYNNEVELPLIELELAFPTTPTHEKQAYRKASNED